MAQPYNLVLYQGDDFELVFRLKNKGTGTPINITGCTPKADIKITASDTTVKASFGASILDATDGTVKLVLTGTQTAALAAGTALVYDAQLKWPDNKVKTYLSGTIAVLPEVTRGS
jgi:hypothetical protein